VLLKGGTTASGARATLTHTGWLSSDGQVYRGLFQQAGVVPADSLHDLVAIATIGARQRDSWKRGRVAVIGNSGGMNALIADKCHSAGLGVPPIAPGTVARVAELLPSFIQPSNPVDLQQGVFTHPERVAQLVRLLHDSGTHNAFVIALHSVYDDLGYQSETLIRSMALLADTGLGLVLVPFNCQDDFAPRARSAGLTVIEDVSRLGAALSIFAEAGSEARPADAGPVVTHRLLSQAESRRLLEEGGIPFGTWAFASSADEAARHAAAAGFPVAVKVEASDVAHKSDIGGVALGITSPAEVMDAFDTVTAAGRHADSQVHGVIVEQMAPPGVEVAVGMRRMDDLGAVLMFGLGGVFIELLGDVTFRIAPLDDDAAARMVDATRGAALLNGHRGAPPMDTEALIRLLVALGRFALDHPEVAEVDLNPVIVLPVGEGVVSVDAVVGKRT
jgi:acyl-CoA synthetase (NDP forming)